MAPAATLGQNEGAELERARAHPYREMAFMPRAVRSSRFALAGVWICGALCLPLRADPAPAQTEAARALDWTLGEWRGVRRDGADGSEGRMSVRVEPILGGAGQIEQLEVEHEGGVYRGFAVQMLDPELGRWVRQYVNSTRGRFVRIEGEVEPDGARSVWRSVAPERTRESRLVSERVEPKLWRRTMHVSEDQGQTWRVLWTDELERLN